MKKHNFISENYRIETQKRLEKYLVIFSAILLLLNILAVYRLKLIYDANRAVVKPVFNSTSVNYQKGIKAEGSVKNSKAYDIYRFIVDNCDEDVKIENLECDENKAVVKIKAVNIKKCIEVFKRIDQNDDFQIDGAEPSEEYKKYCNFILTVKRKE